ncbi:twin-arginine translocase TatA/TatE family subunit [Halobacteriovorax marinus]|uniref:twin-arginine translocase TatA/TatE family subunit n=1 Tax=Halobacteriovorax marinus TaxID=97084 RepID=UPI003A954408
MFGIGGAELLIIFVFALLFIGPKKLPELARGLGKGIREFQKAKDDLLDQVNAPAETKDNTQNLSSSDAPSETITTSEDNKKTSDDSNA